MVGAGELTQALVAVGQGIFGIDLICQCLVIGRLGFLHVGDGDHAHVIALLGLVQLQLHRFQIGLHIFQGINGGEHGKVGLGGTHHQILLGQVVAHIALGGLLGGDTAVDPVAAAIDSLGETQIGTSCTCCGLVILVSLLIVEICAQIDLWQIGSIGFVDLLEGGIPLRLGLLQLGILFLSLLVDIDQTLGVGRGAHPEQNKGRNHRFFHNQELLRFLWLQGGSQIGLELTTSFSVRKKSEVGTRSKGGGEKKVVNDIPFVQPGR